MRKMLVLTLLSVLMSTVSFVQAIEIDTPPYVNLSQGSSGDGGLNLTESASLVSGSSCGHGTIEFTLTNSTSTGMLNVQFIPSILLWEWRDSGNNWYRDKLYYQSDTGNTVRYSNTINGKEFITDFTYMDYSDIDDYDVDDDFAAFWDYSWTTYSAGVDELDQNKFYGKSLGNLDPSQFVTFYLQTNTTVDNIPFPDVEWGVPGEDPITQFGFDWDDAGILDDSGAPVPEPLTFILLCISSLGLFLRKK